MTESKGKIGCGCEATISENDPRAEIWLYVFEEDYVHVEKPFWELEKEAK